MTAYCPFIKGKLNDLKSLGKLSNDTWKNIRPCIDLAPMVDLDGAVESHLNKFIKYMGNLPDNCSVYVDMYGFVPGQTTVLGQSAVIAGFESVQELNIQFTPVYGLKRDDSIWPALKEIVIKTGQRFCFRLTEEDIAYDAESTWQSVIERTSELGLMSENVDLILDFRSVEGNRISYYEDLVIDFLLINQNAHKYNNVIVAGSSALKTVSEVPKDGVLDVYRSELKIWVDLLTELDSRLSLKYGDYGVVHPDFLIGGSSKYMNAKIRYTDKTSIVYYRGHGLTYPVSDYGQYRSLAKKVVDSVLYMGREFSFGDDYIYTRATDFNSKTGSPATWVLSDMNHHVTIVAKQVSAILQTHTEHISATPEMLLSV